MLENWGPKVLTFLKDQVFLLVLAAGLGQLLHVQERERVLSRQPSTGIGISSQFHPAARSSALFFSRGGREGGEEAPCSIASSVSSSTKTPRSTGRPRRRCSSGSCSSWMVEPAMCRRPRSLARSLACLLGSNSATMLTTRPTSCCSTTCLGPGSLKLATTVVLEIPGANLGQEGAHAGAHGGAHAVRAALMMQPRPERASEPGGGGGGCGPRTGRRPTD
mmetsp:Transcript_1567/g.2749  ORF Transcript_1567/g.2749 Transcript_1567/m.2749 type:complete len:220 (+) Transcript_1567:163-822(+)